MALSPKLELRQGQQLVMTPQLQQAIRLLQLSNIELNEFVEAELERNPLLERDEEGEVATAERSIDDLAGDRETPGSNEEGESWLDLSKSRADPEAAFDTDIADVYPDTPANELDVRPPSLSDWSSVRPSGGAFDGEISGAEALAVRELTLKDHLSEQAALSIRDPSDRLVAQYLIDFVSDTGYLVVDLETVAERLGAALADVERVLAVLQTFDPPGVCARNLAECLALQLKERNRYDPQIARLLDNLDLLGRHDVAQLRKVVDVDMDELSDMIAELKGLVPKPGLKFGTTQVQTIVPDVIVRPAADGSWIVELNSETLPKVLINRSYFALVSNSTKPGKDKEYLQDCLQSANWLANSLDQRARTILKVSEEIIRQQDAFLTHGVRHLRPLNLRTVADAISMHESTVSRVTSNKYMSTPRGLFELKYFFTSAINSTDDGNSHSSESVRHRIKELIDGESAEHVLSDDSIVNILKADGIDIARRTVAKYREALKIPSSVQRRREKRMAAKMVLAH